MISHRNAYPSITTNLQPTGMPSRSGTRDNYPLLGPWKFALTSLLVIGNTTAGHLEEGFDSLLVTIAVTGSGVGSVSSRTLVKRYVVKALNKTSG
jgi:hypothetical protein